MSAPVKPHYLPTSTAKPETRAIPDLNVERLVVETLPGQIRAVQSEISELERSLIVRRARLARLLDTAVLYGVELCPASPVLPTRPENGNAGFVLADLLTVSDRGVI